MMPVTSNWFIAVDVARFGVDYYYYRLQTREITRRYSFAAPRSRKSFGFIS